jgi:hypothetical protein
MKNDTAVSIVAALAIIALVCVPVTADIAPPQVCRIDTPQNAAQCPDDICLYYNTTCVNETRMVYPQEYFVLSNLADNAYMYISTGNPSATMVGTYAEQLSAIELRRQTILMEKQNELLAEQNELMGRLVNATEIKFVVYPNPVYATQATSWNLDEPDASPSFNVSNYEYTPNEVDKISCDSLSRFQGCS